MTRPPHCSSGTSNGALFLLRITSGADILFAVSITKAEAISYAAPAQEKAILGTNKMILIAQVLPIRVSSTLSTGFENLGSSIAHRGNDAVDTGCQYEDRFWLGFRGQQSGDMRAGGEDAPSIQDRRGGVLSELIRLDVASSYPSLHRGPARGAKQKVESETSQAS
ncbi:unnamed protein product [Cyclocybe aegerita]|uniref:Uncharacterized protein n=1 Tax=Cyclocybe aegerita TaxID=1973307 RepID=A0A8S0VRX1_CYCAE|nr:unnamed protein product [Cyclocybe aegerita]